MSAPVRAGEQLLVVVVVVVVGLRLAEGNLNSKLYTAVAAHTSPNNFFVSGGEMEVCVCVCVCVCLSVIMGMLCVI